MGEVYLFPAIRFLSEFQMILLDAAFQFCVLQPQEKSPARALSIIQSLPIRSPDLFYDSFEKAAKILPRHISAKMALTVVKSSRCVSCRAETETTVDRYSLPITSNVIRMQTGRTTDTQSIVRNLLTGIPFKRPASQKQTENLFAEPGCRSCGATVEPIREYRLVNLGSILSLLLHSTGPQVSISQVIRAGGKTFNLAGVVCVGSNGLGLIVCTPLSCSIVQTDRGLVTESRVELREIMRYLKHEPCMLTPMGKPIAAIYRLDVLNSAPSMTPADPDATLPSDEVSDVNEEVLRDPEMIKIFNRTKQGGIDSVPRGEQERGGDRQRRRNFELDDTINNSYSITQHTHGDVVPYGGGNPNSQLAVISRGLSSRLPPKLAQRSERGGVSMPVNVDTDSFDAGISSGSPMSDIMVLQESSKDSRGDEGSGANIRSYVPLNRRTEHRSVRDYGQESHNSVSLRGAPTRSGDVSGFRTFTTDGNGSVSLRVKTTKVGQVVSQMPSERVLYDTQVNTVSTIPYVKSRLITSKIAFLVIVCISVFLALAVAVFIGLIVEYCLFLRSLDAENTTARYSSLVVNTLNIIGSNKTVADEYEYNDIANANQPWETEDTPIFDLIVYGTISVNKAGVKDTTSTTYIKVLDTGTMEAARVDLSSAITELYPSFDIFEALGSSVDDQGYEFPDVNFSATNVTCDTLYMDNLSVQTTGTKFTAVSVKALNDTKVKGNMIVGIEGTGGVEIGGSRLETASPCYVSGACTITGSLSSDNVEVSDASTTKFSSKISSVTKVNLTGGWSSYASTSDSMTISKIPDINILSRSVGVSGPEVGEVNVNNALNTFTVTAPLAQKIGHVELVGNINLLGGATFSGPLQKGTTYDADTCLDTPLNDIIFNGTVTIDQLTTNTATVSSLELSGDTFTVTGEGTVTIDSLIYGDTANTALTVNRIIATPEDPNSSYTVTPAFELGKAVVFKASVSANKVSVGSGSMTTDGTNMMKADGTLQFATVTTDTVAPISPTSAITVKDGTFTESTSTTIESIIMGTGSLLDFKSPTASVFELGTHTTINGGTLITNDLVLGVASVMSCPGVVLSTTNTSGVASFDVTNITSMTISGTLSVQTDNAINVSVITNPTSVVTVGRIETYGIDFKNEGKIVVADAPSLCDAIEGKPEGIVTLNTSKLSFGPGASVTLPTDAKVCADSMIVTDSTKTIPITKLSVKTSLTAESSFYSLKNITNVASLEIDSTTLTFSNASVEVSGSLSTGNVKVTNLLTLSSTEKVPFSLSTKKINGILVPKGTTSSKFLKVTSLSLSADDISKILNGVASTDYVVADKGTIGLS